jgi:hypothetical protein
VIAYYCCFCVLDTLLTLLLCCADSYKPKVVGMMWSSLAQLQTWFGSEPWKSYGIQVRLHLGGEAAVQTIFHAVLSSLTCSVSGYS